MFKDNDGNPLIVTQGLFDAIQLSEREILDRFTSRDRSMSIEELTAELVNFTRSQAAHCMSAVGNLESRLIALQRAAGIDEFEYSAVDIRLVKSEDEDGDNPPQQQG